MGFGHRRPPATQQGPGRQGPTRPALPSGERRSRGENRLLGFPEPRRVGAVVGCPRRLSLCRMQPPEARFGPSVRRGLGDDRPRWLRGHGWGVGPEGLRAPNPASPPRRTRGEWVSGARDPQQSSRAQGARGSPAPLCPMESGGPGVETACVEFLHRGTVRLWFAAGGEFPFAGCSSQKLVLGRHCVGTSALSGLAGWGAWLGTGRRRPSSAQSCFPTKENLMGVGFGRGDPQQNSRAQGARGSPAPLCPMDSGGPGV